MSPTSASSAVKKPSTDESRIGEHAAMQPLSGISLVTESGAVNGLGHGAYLRQEESNSREKKKA
jgi:hypothetical protein